MDWQKSILKKDIIYCLKYQKFYVIFSINNHISNNSIQINIKFTFTMYEYTIVHEVYEYILLSNLINIYIYICYKYVVNSIYWRRYVICCSLLFIHLYTLVTMVSHSQSFPAGFTWSLSLAETTYQMVNMIKVINEEARAT